MDTQKQSLETSIKNSLIEPPAQLWIGSAEQLITEAKKFLQKRWCPHAGCSLCSECRAIEAGQHYSIRWLAPDGTYKREDLEDLFATIAFSLEETQEYFFIIQKADCLTAACYNSLLKSIEEPPRGYHFIFFAQRFDDVAATIRSRCTVRQFTSSAIEPLAHPLAALFSSLGHVAPITFLQTLEQSQPNEQTTIDLLDALLGYWLLQNKQAHANNNHILVKRAELILSLLKTALEEPPMPGSSSLFWKQLFIQIHPI